MCFLLNLAKFRRTPFLQNTSGRLLLPLAFRQQPPKLCYKKAVLENFATFIEKHLWFVKSLRTLFLLNTSAAATLLKSGTANSVRKTLDEYYLSRNTNFKSTVQEYHFLFSSNKMQIHRNATNDVTAFVWFVDSLTKMFKTMHCKILNYSCRIILNAQNLQ